VSLFPLDTLKTRLQSREGFFASGGFRHIYRGIGSAFVGSAPSAALFFVTYDSAKRGLLALAAAADPSTERTVTGQPITAPREVDATVAAGIHMAAASAGEIVGCVVRVPVEVVKQRTQAVHHPSSLAALQHILRSNKGKGAAGLARELYRGGGITLLRELPFTMIQFPLWEALKAWHVNRVSADPPPLAAAAGAADGGRPIGAVPSALYGSLAGAVAAGLTTPLDVLKTRLMLSRERIGAATMLRMILNESGPKALFAGIGPRIMWISAGGAVFLGSYQWASNAMEGNRI
jgi:solute carrier family 25 S-adenosylmethionine transporter 26